MTAPRPALDPDAFRATLGRFAAGVTVLTARDDAGRDHGMTVSAFASRSLDPPLVLACVDRAASMHPLFAVGAPFVVNVVLTFLACVQASMQEVRRCYAPQS